MPLQRENRQCTSVATHTSWECHCQISGTDYFSGVNGLRLLHEINDFTEGAEHLEL